VVYHHLDDLHWRFAAIARFCVANPPPKHDAQETDRSRGVSSLRMSFYPRPPLPHQACCLRPFPRLSNQPR
jgi:hypothetical protein